MNNSSTNPLLLTLGKITVIIFTLWILIQAFTSSPSWTILDYANLGIHEAGHLITLPFGMFVHILGGSLVQVLIPLLAAFGFYYSRQCFSAAFCLFWLGESMNYLSVYIGDAQTMSLPLLGGDGSIHDWNWLLTQMHLLPETHFISSIVWGIAIVCMFAGIGWMGFNSIRRLKKSFKISY